MRECFLSSSPFLTGGSFDITQFQSATPLVQVRDELVSMLRLLFRSMLEVFGNAVESDYITVEMGGHGQVDIAGIKLQIDLLVDFLLGFSMEILTNLTDSHYCSLTLRLTIIN
uniref:Uncharacterized protein n=1 Tax=Cacopsylla melanoneura TaxID=428564 RepID=A0A8D9E9S2_9HEMI